MKEITNESLMLGDWVNITIEGDVYPGKITKLDGETDDVRVVFLAAPGDWEEGDMFDEIYPIPLTDSILKKNGFKYHHRNFASLCYGDSFILELREWPDENGFGGLWIVGGIFEVRYVHQLQNLMRFYGIDKEIEI